MLAQNFKTAADLGVNEAEYGALQKVLGMLERDELVHSETCRLITNGFNMGTTGIQEGCGTVACIAGWVCVLTDTPFPGSMELAKRVHGKSLRSLYFPPVIGEYHKITPPQAAIALRNYLTTGEPRWAEALAE